MLFLPALIGLLLAAPPASSASPMYADAAPCAGATPPCGQINPRLVVAFEGLDPAQPYELHAGDRLALGGNVTFTFNAGDEGFAPPDPNQPIVISFAFPRRPFWAEIKVEPAQIPVTLTPDHFRAGGNPSAPTLVYVQTFDVQLVITAIDEPYPSPGYPYAKLQVFAKSSQSGIYNPGYGVKEVRTMAEFETGHASSTPAPPVPLVAVGSAALALIRGRRRTT